MYWNHRVLRRTEHGVNELLIVEVYYDDEDNSVLGWTENAVAPWGDEEYDGIEGIRQTLTWMLEALDKPILDEAQLLEESERRGPLYNEEELERFESFEELLAALDSIEEEEDAEDQG